jgi:predicted permease
VRRGATWTETAHRVEAVGDVLVRERIHPPPDVRLSIRLVPWQRATTNNIRQPLLVLWAAVLVVLIIGCVNIAGLLLSRASARAREIATRIAIGGGRVAIVRQLLVESLLLAALGGIGGVGLGYLLSRSITAQLSDVVALPTSPDLRVLSISAGAALATSLLFGLFPALRVSRTDVRGTLGDAGGASIAGRSSNWPMRALVISQVALGIVLVVAAGLLIRTFSHLARQRPGFDATNVITATMSLQDARYRTSDSVNSLFTRTLARIRQSPGVVDAAVALSLPYERALNQGWRFDGEAAVRPDTVTFTYVTPDYFRTLKIPLLRGRIFDEGDTSSSRQVVVVNDAFVRQFSPDKDAVDRRIHLGGPTVPAVDIIGIVGTIQQRATNVNGQPVAALPGVFVASAQYAAQYSDAFVLAHTWFQPSWIVRTQGNVPIISSLQRALREVDPTLTFNRFRTIDDVESETMTTPRTLAWLLGVLAAIALSLCVVGIYGVVANTVAQRRRELGVRIALGATPFDTIRAAAAGSIALALCGALAGLALSLPAATVMRQVVFGVSVTDPLTLVGAVVIVVLAAVIAAVLPACRTLRMNVIAVLNSW